VLVICAVVTLAATGAGCGGRAASLGAGDDVDLCRGYREIDAFVEPRADRPADILGYADGVLRVLDRMQTDIPIRRPNADPVVPPASTAADIGLMQREVEAFRSSLGSPGDAPAVRAALNTFATNATYNEADGRLAAFVAKTCPR